MHGVADPQDGLPRLPYGLDHPGQLRFDVLGPEPVNQREPTGHVLRIERRDEPLQPGGIHPRADLHADGIGDTPEILDVRAVKLGGTHADPRHMRGKVVPAILTGNEACLRLLIEQMQPFVTAIEVDERRFVHTMTADPLEEIQRVTDGVHDALVGILQLRVFDEPQIPIFRVVQIGKAAVHQGAYKVQRQRRAFIAAQQ